ncbi:MAG: sulfatase family protein [Aeoliella sp.]
MNIMYRRQLDQFALPTPACWLGFLLFVSMASCVSAAERPNVIIIYGDDVGYADVGVYGSKLIPTPNIDKLASEGLVFTDGHCSAATCTPSRFSLLTGIHGFRHGVRVLPPNAPMKIQPGMFTLPQLFRKAGYETAVIGKWHLGLGDGKTPVDWNGDVKPGPLEVGFDYSFLLPSTNDRVPCVYVENHRVVNLDPNDPLFVGKRPDGVESTEYPDGKTDRAAMTYYQSSHGHNNSVINGIGRIGYQWGGKSALWNDETMADEFVKQTRKYLATRTKHQPFFLYFSSQDIHVPRAPHPRFKGKSQLTYRGDAMVQLDWAAGEVLKAIDEQGLTENSLVIFSSDNGPVYDDGYEDGTTVRTSTQESDRGHDGSGPYRGGKYQIYEGGTRVPLIVKWPGRIKPGKSGALVNQIDFIASFADLLDIKLQTDEAIDSRNILPALLGDDDQGLPFTVEEARGIALRRGPWKWVRQQGKKKSALYNLDTDIDEQSDVSKKHPAVAQEMQALLQKIIDAKQGVRQISG